jgi:outer membrane lipoprotein-sorting protein
MWRNPGGLGDLGDIARYPTQATMPNNTDVTEYYLRNEKVMDIMCDVYKISRSTFWVDPETGFTLKLEARDEQGNLDEDVNYEVTRLVVGTPDWDGEHLHPLPTDTEEESIKFPENKSNIGSSTYSS